MAACKGDLGILLELEKKEFTLITKALCGKLRLEEMEEARTLGISLMEEFTEDLDRKAQAAKHALEKAKENE